MAFILDQSESYSWPVTVKVPQDGGRFRSFTFDAEFKRVSQERREQLGRQLMRQKHILDDGRMEDDFLTPRQIADELLVGWGGIMNTEGADAEPVPFSEKVKAQLLNIGDVADAILEAWNASIPGAKAKN
tara:strand:- start:426 stop:815 length:390 start_codon:yes stop_codon:yes gene_type:complete